MLVDILFEVIIKITVLSSYVIIAISIILAVSCVSLDDFELSDVVN
jgi:hypothetical protein